MISIYPAQRPQQPVAAQQRYAKSTMADCIASRIYGGLGR
jgi:hypothetical protein